MHGRPLKVLLKSAFSQYSGYGQDGFGMLRALHRWGCDVYPQPVGLDVPIPTDLLPLFGKTLAGPFDLTINHWDPTNLGITREARQMTSLAVAWTMWEFSDLRPHGKRRSTLRSRLRWFDVLLGYDQVSVDAVAPYVPRGVATGVLQGGFEAGAWPAVSRDWFGDRFLFIQHGALGNRKAPFTTLQAFLELKHDKGDDFKDARLAFHTMVPPLIPEMNALYEAQGVKVFFEAWDDATLHEFYRSAHVMVCPSHGEGKNLPALEFQSTGGVVAATNWGGHTQWLRPDVAYPLDYTLAPVFGKHPGLAKWAEVPIQAVKDTMWHAYTHREECARRGELATRLIPSMCDWSVVVEDLFRRCRDLVPVQGSRIYDMAMACRVDPRDRREER